MFHEKYGLSKTREAEDMCNYSEYLRQEAKEEAREEQKLKDNLKVLEQLDLLHISDKKIMTILQIDTEQLKTLRLKLYEKSQTVVNAD